MTTLEEYLSAQTPAFRKKVKAEFRQMSLQCAVSRLRYEQNLTQQEVARKLQLSQSAVSKIERNALDVKLSDLVRYVNILGGKLSLQVDLPSGEKIVVASFFHWLLLLPDFHQSRILPLKIVSQLCAHRTLIN